MKRLPPIPPIPPISPIFLENDELFDWSEPENDELLDWSEPVIVESAAAAAGESAAVGGFGMFPYRTEMMCLPSSHPSRPSRPSRPYSAGGSAAAAAGGSAAAAGGSVAAYAAADGGYGKSTFVSKLCHDEDEQVTASSYQYDVFLSFRGEDTRESFTSTLLYSLCKVHKVKTFMDDNFKKGSKLEELLKMVEESRISVVVFSENFAQSKWCLKELAKIFEERDRRGHEVVPVFYKVSPSELRCQDRGKTKVHMEKHHNTYGKDSDIVKTWSKAITELGNLSGYTYRSGKGIPEAKLADEIAQDILNRLNNPKSNKGRHSLWVNNQEEDHGFSSPPSPPPLPPLPGASSIQQPSSSRPRLRLPPPQLLQLQSQLLYRQPRTIGG